MKIKMLKNIPQYKGNTYNIDRVYEVEAETGQRWLKHKIAIETTSKEEDPIVKKPKKPKE